MSSVLSKLYSSIIQSVDKYVPQKLRPLWVHPAGPKTIFFWAPLCKWGLVIAGIGDLARPAELISLNQAATIATTGFIWSRYSLIIIPKNWMMFSVNMFMAFTQLVQVARALQYQQSHKELEVKKVSQMEEYWKKAAQK